MVSRISTKITHFAAVALMSCVSLSTLTASVSAAEQSKVALVLNQPEGDPFGDLVYSGVEKLKTEQPTLEIKRLANVQATAYEQQLRTLARDGYSPIIVLWDDLAAAVGKLAPNFPDTKFIIMDSYADPKLPNVATVAIDPVAAAYLGGIVAAKTSKTGKIGFVGGAEQPVITKYLCGFESGVKSVSDKDQMVVNYAGTFVDPRKGREIALAQISQGVDVLMHAANRTGLGVLKAAQEKGVYGVGVDMWQGDVAPKSVVWTAVKDAGTAAYTSTKSAVDGQFKPGQSVWDAQAGANLFDQRDLDGLSPETRSVIDEAINGLKAGKIKPAC